MIKFDNSGLEKFQQKLKQHQTNTVSLDELFHVEFMRENTRFHSIDAMFANSPFQIKTEDDFATIDDKELDKFIKSNTQFDSWEEMKLTAATEWMSKKLFS